MGPWGAHALVGGEWWRFFSRRQVAQLAVAAEIRPVALPPCEGPPPFRAAPGPRLPAGPTQAARRGAHAPRSAPRRRRDHRIRSQWLVQPPGRVWARCCRGQGGGAVRWGYALEPPAVAQRRRSTLATHHHFEGACCGILGHWHWVWVPQGAAAASVGWAGLAAMMPARGVRQGQ